MTEAQSQLKVYFDSLPNRQQKKYLEALSAPWIKAKALITNATTIERIFELMDHSDKARKKLLDKKLGKSNIVPKKKKRKK